MNEPFRRPPTASDDADLALWSAEQGALLRAGRFDAIDRDNIAEEIESLGRSDKREIEHRLNVLLVFLLKWKAQPSHRQNGWRAMTREQRARIAKLVAQIPSLKTVPASELAAEYELARLKAADETDLPEDNLPVSCPFTIAQVLDRDFLPEQERH